MAVSYTHLDVYKRQEAMRIETKRLIMREMTENDLPELRKILQDEEVMYAYEHAVSEEEVIKWFENQQRRYREDGFGLWAAVLKDSGETVSYTHLQK